MKLDTFTFDRPEFYRKKALFLYKLKKAAYSLQRKDLDNDWRLYLEGRASLLKNHCRNRKVLDVGCGDGKFLDELERHYNARELCGLDISEAMIAQAKRNYKHHDYVIGSGDNLPFDDKSFDVLTFQWVFHHMSPDVAQQTLKEATRVSRKTVIIQDTIRHESGLMYFLSLMYWKTVDGGVCYRTEDQWREFFETNGLNLIGEHFGNIIRTGIFVLQPIA